MRIWTLSHHDEEMEVYAVFSSAEAANASAEERDLIHSHEVRTSPLRMEERWRVVEQPRSDRHAFRSAMGPPKKYVVNELSPEFGAGVVGTSGRFGDGARTSAPTAAEAMGAFEAEVDLDNEQESARRAHLARRTHQFTCPDHGDLGMGPPDSQLPCLPCRRWVNVAGQRFGRYETSTAQVDGWGGWVSSFSFSVGEGTDKDLGPLPEADRRVD